MEVDANAAMTYMYRPVQAHRTKSVFSMCLLSNIQPMAPSFKQTVSIVDVSST